MQEQNEESKGDCKTQSWCWQKVSWRLDNRKSKDAAMALSVVIVQIFHKRINKLRMLMCQKKKKERKKEDGIVPKSFILYRQHYPDFESSQRYRKKEK